MAGDPELDAAAGRVNMDAERISREIADIDRQMSKLTQQLAREIVPERAYRTTVDDPEARRAEVTSSLRAAESLIALTPAEPSRLAQGLVNDWLTAPLQTTRATIRSLID